MYESQLEEVKTLAQTVIYEYSIVCVDKLVLRMCNVSISESEVTEGKPGISAGESGGAD